LVRAGKRCDPAVVLLVARALGYKGTPIAARRRHRILHTRDPVA